MSPSVYYFHLDAYDVALDRPRVVEAVVTASPSDLVVAHLEKTARETGIWKSFHNFGFLLAIPEPLADGNEELLLDLHEDLTFEKLDDILGDYAQKPSTPLTVCSGGFGSPSIDGPLVFTLQEIYRYVGYPLSALGVAGAWQLIRKGLYAFEYKNQRKLIKKWRATGRVSKELKQTILNELQVGLGYWKPKDFSRIFDTTEQETGDLLRGVGLRYSFRKNVWVKRHGLIGWWRRAR